jgi:hypothetical protein
MTMHTADLLLAAFDNIRGGVHRVVDGCSPDLLSRQLDAEANTIAWLVWHLSRVQDDHVADVAGTEQVWVAEGWADRFGLPFEPGATGWGQSADEVASVRVTSGELLTGYYDAVHERTVAFVRGLTADDLDRIVDESWDPPVTLGVRLVSVLGDDLQHVGQAAFARGLLERATGDS